MTGRRTSDEGATLVRIRLLSAVLLAAAVVAPTLAGATLGECPASHALIQGSGSSWAANAVNQWVADVQSAGHAGRLHPER